MVLGLKCSQTSRTQRKTKMLCITLKMLHLKYGTFHQLNLHYIFWGCQCFLVFQFVYLLVTLYHLFCSMISSNLLSLFNTFFLHTLITARFTAVKSPISNFLSFLVTFLIRTKFLFNILYYPFFLSCQDTGYKFSACMHWSMRSLVCGTRGTQQAD